MAVFYGQVKPHLCDENNEIVKNYIQPNQTDSCGLNCSMETSYHNDFGLLCKDAYLQQFVTLYLFVGQFFGSKFSHSFTVCIGRSYLLKRLPLFFYASLLEL